jgi:hypothetical protein
MVMSRSEAGRLGAEKTKQTWRRRYKESPKYCAFCEKELPYEKRLNKFCNHSCAASFNNTDRKKERYCLNCEKELVEQQKKFCTHTCHKLFQWQEMKRLIEETGITAGLTSAKRYLREVRGNQCEVCGVGEWQGKDLVLILDHINGNPCDHKVDNLRLLCPNCDSQTDTYKGKNKGNGRHYRRVRYAEGKSF